MPKRELGSRKRKHFPIDQRVRWTLWVKGQNSSPWQLKGQTLQVFRGQVWVIHAKQRHSSHSAGQRPWHQLLWGHQQQPEHRDTGPPGRDCMIRAPFHRYLLEDPLSNTVTKTNWVPPLTKSGCCSMGWWDDYSERHLAPVICMSLWNLRNIQVLSIQMKILYMTVIYK